MKTKIITAAVRQYFCGEEVEEAPNGEEVVGTNNDARLKMLENIADSSETERVREEGMAEMDDDGNAIPPATTEAVEVEEEPPAAVAKPVEPTKIIRKINGVDTEITDDMLVKAMKVASADVYLQEAANIRRELATKQPSNTDAATKEVSDDQALLESVRAIQMGTEEDAAAALRKLLAANQPPKVDVHATIAKEVDERLAFDQAYKRFATEYKDILEDPVLLNLARQRDDQLIKNGDKRPYYDRFKETGDTLRAWQNERIAKVTGKPVEELTTSTKQARKEAAAAAAPKAAGGRQAAPQNEDEKEESSADVIAKMRQARGLAMRA